MLVKMDVILYLAEENFRSCIELLKLIDTCFASLQGVIRSCWLLDAPLNETRKKQNFGASISAFGGFGASSNQQLPMTHCREARHVSSVVLVVVVMKLFILIVLLILCGKRAGKIKKKFNTNARFNLYSNKVFLFLLINRTYIYIHISHSSTDIYIYGNLSSVNKHNGNK